MDRICKHGRIHWRTSPLCNDRVLFNNLKQISDDRWVDFWLLVWIAFAESHIWINFAPVQSCWKANNRAWIKNEKFDNGSSSHKHYKTTRTIRWCSLYVFDDVEHFWRSFANSIKFWYINARCYSARCISKYRVKNDKIEKPHWYNRVNLFIKK